MKKSERTRHQLLDAALRIISRKGYSAATVDEIVAEAGVSKGVAYYHFKSKADMAMSILNQEMEALTASMQARATEAPNAPEALLAMLDEFASLLFGKREFARFFMSELWRGGRIWSDDLRKRSEALAGLVAGQLARGQADGSIRPELDPAFTAVGIIGFVLTNTLYVIDPESASAISPERFKEQISDFVRHACAHEALRTGVVSAS